MPCVLRGNGALSACWGSPEGIRPARSWLTLGAGRYLVDLVQISCGPIMPEAPARAAGAQKQSPALMPS